MRVGLIGASRIATNAMIEPARAVDGVKVHGVAARDESRARAFADRHAIARVFADYDALLADPAIDLVYISTPPSTHAVLAEAAIGAGKPVLVEKPFSLTSAEARRVRDLARAAGVPVFEAMHSPHHRLFGRVLDIVRSGGIGRPRRVDATFGVSIPDDDPIRWDASLGGGALMDLGVYPLAWTRRIAGERFRVTGVDAEMRHGVDARFSASLQFETDIAATIGASMLADEFGAWLRIEGEEGVVEVDNPVAPQIGHLLTISSPASMRQETVAGETTYAAQLRAVRDTVLMSAPFPFAEDDFVRSMQAIEAIRTCLPAG